MKYTKCTRCMRCTKCTRCMRTQRDVQERNAARVWVQPPLSRFLIVWLK